MADRLIYTGIGSRRTPALVRADMSALAKSLATAGYVLRSGGAPGADQAFEAGAGNAREIYLPWNGFEGRSDRQPGMIVADDRSFARAISIVRDVHPNWAAVERSRGAVRLHARNAFQVLGADLASPADFVVCWAPVVNDSIEGGTRTAYELARQHGIPTFNLAVERDQQRLTEKLGNEIAARTSWNLAASNDPFVLVHGPGDHGAEFAAILPIRQYLTENANGEVRQPHYVAGPFTTEAEATIERSVISLGSAHLIEQLSAVDIAERFASKFTRVASQAARELLAEEQRADELAYGNYIAPETSRVAPNVTINVGNIQQEGAAAGEYIGRKWRDIPASPLGNPFAIGKDGTRDEVIDKYREWIDERTQRRDPAVLAELERLADIAARGPLRILCHCHPERCHGDVLRPLIRDLVLERAAALVRVDNRDTTANARTTPADIHVEAIDGNRDPDIFSLAEARAKTGERVAILIPTNRELRTSAEPLGIMGAGLAQLARDRFPALRLEARLGRANSGLPTVLAGLSEAPYAIVAFHTKEAWRDKASLELIEAQARALGRTLESVGPLDAVLVPRLGAGRGGLRWSDVKPILKRHLASEQFLFLDEQRSQPHLPSTNRADANTSSPIGVTTTVADLSNQQIAALSRGFYELAQRELRTPGGLQAPQPNIVSQILAEEISLGRLMVADGRFSVIDEDAREEIIDRVRAALGSAIRVHDSAVALHAGTPRSDYALILHNSPTVFDHVAGDMVFLDATSREATLERIARCKAATIVADQNIRYCYSDLAAFGGKYLPNVPVPTVVMPNANVTGDGLAIIHDASRPAPHRVEKLANTLEAGPGRALASIAEGSTRADIVKQLSGLTRYELEHLDDNVNRLLHEIRRTTREQRPRPRDGRAITGAERTEERQVVDLFRREDPAISSRDRIFVAGPNPQSIEGLIHSRAVSRVDDPTLRMFLADRSHIEKQIEIYNADASGTEQLRTPVELGNRLTGTIPIVSRQHFVVRRTDGRYAVVPIKDIATTTIGVRGSAQDGPPMWKLLDEISRVGAATTLRMGPDGLIAFRSERPQTVMAQRKRTEQEERGKNLEYEEQREIMHDLAVSLENGRNAFARAHDRAPQTLGVISLEDREENIVYRGPIVDVGRWYFTQAVGGQIVPHEIAAFDRTPAVGENWAITYPDGSQLIRGNASVLARRDERVAEFVQRSVPELVDERSRQELSRQLGIAARVAADLTQQDIEALNTLSLDVGDRGKYAGSVIHASSLYSFMLVDDNKLVTLDHRRLARTFDVGDTLTIRSDVSAGLTVGDIVRSEARVDRERAEQFDDRQSAASAALALAQRRIGDQHVSQLLGLPPEAVRERTEPRLAEPARVVLATSAATYFVFERDGQPQIWATPTYHDGKLAEGIEVALAHGEVALTQKHDVTEIAPRGEVRVLGSVPIHTFRELMGRRDPETGKYVGDTYVGQVAAIDGPVVVVDVGNYDLLALDREELIETGAQIEVGQPVTVQYTPGGIAVNDRPVEQEIAHERTPGRER